MCYTCCVLQQKSKRNNKSKCHSGSADKSCLTLCDPMGCSTPGSSVLHCLQEFTQIQAIESVMLSNHSILCCSLLLLPSISLRIRVFSSESELPIRWSKFWSFSFSISLSRNNQVWLPLRFSGLTSLLSEELSKVFSSTTVQKHQFFSAQSSYGKTQSIHEYWENHSFDQTELCQQLYVFSF